MNCSFFERYYFDLSQAPNAGPISDRASAKSTTACKYPSFDPVSYRTHFVAIAVISSCAERARIKPSARRFSPPLLTHESSMYLHIAGVMMYFPMTACREVVSSGRGFSRNWVTR